MPAILWLQEYLLNETEDQTIVIVSHDRSFLNAVTEETIIFKDKQLKYHAGNFEDWDRNTEEQRIRKQNMLVVCIQYIFQAECTVGLISIYMLPGAGTTQEAYYGQHPTQRPASQGDRWR